MNQSLSNKKTDAAGDMSFAYRDLRALGMGALAVVAIGNGMVYDLPKLNKAVDVPGINASITPTYVHNSGYDMHLGFADLVVNVPGNYSALVKQGDKLVDSKSFVVTAGQASEIQLAGTSRGGLQFDSNAGFGWANYPGDFTLTLTRSTEAGTSTYTANF